MIPFSFTPLAGYALAAAIVVGLYHVTPVVGPGARIERLREDVKAAKAETLKVRGELQTCQRSRSTLEASIAAQNQAVGRLREESEARVAESAKAVRSARVVAESHRREIERLRGVRLGPDACAEADRLIVGAR
jgi:predicted  nucleic acid-binding Zn-ribbon protein